MSCPVFFFRAHYFDPRSPSKMTDFEMYLAPGWGVASWALKMRAVFLRRPWPILRHPRLHIYLGGSFQKKILGHHQDFFLGHNFDPYAPHRMADFEVHLAPI